jgi:hypothetical protein
MKYLVLILGFCLPVYAADYYVDASGGNDTTGDGSTGNPYATLTKVQSLGTAGNNYLSNCTVYLRTGTYTWTTEQNKTRTDWFKVTNDVGNTPTISGLVQAARYPTVMADTYLWFEGIAFTGRLNLAFGRYWKVINCTVTGEGYDATTGLPNVTAINLSYTDQALIDRVTITGTGTYNNALTSTGGQSGVNFGTAFRYGINCAYSTTELNTNMTIQNCTVLGCDDSIVVAGNDFTLTNNTVSYFTDNGLTVIGANEYSGTACLIERNTIRYGGKFSGNHIDLIQFNNAYGYYPAYPTVNNLKCRNITVRGNILHDSDQQGMFLRNDTAASENWVIENNLVYNTDLEQKGNGSVRMMGANGIVFRNNTIAKGTVGGPGSGLVMVEDYGLGTVVTSFHNNIVQGMIDLYTVLDTNSGRQVEVTYEDYNVYVTKGFHMSGFSWGANDSQMTSSAISALFANYSASNYRLAAALAGDPTAGRYATDIIGVTRESGADADRGAYEFVSAGAGAPVLAAIGPKSVEEESAISMDANATGGTAPLVYSLVNAPSGCTINSSTGVVSWTPTSSPSQAGTYDVTVVVTDDAALTDTEVVTITVSAIPIANSAPYFNISPGTQVATAGLAWGIVRYATDDDGDTKTWSFSGLPAWASGNTATGEITGTPLYPGRWSITVGVTATGGSDSETWILEVETSPTRYGLF